MNRLTFKNDKVKTLSKMLRWANSQSRRIPYSKTTTDNQGLWLVKDDGIYLMSPTDENFVNKKGDVSTVVYARGYKPTKANRDTLWDKTHAISGDDFVEFVPLSINQVARILSGGDITINLNETQMEIEA